MQDKVIPIPRHTLSARRGILFSPGSGVAPQGSDIGHTRCWSFKNDLPGVMSSKILLFTEDVTMIKALSQNDELEKNSSCIPDCSKA